MPQLLLACAAVAVGVFDAGIFYVGVYSVYESVRACVPMCVNIRMNEFSLLLVQLCVCVRTCKCESKRLFLRLYVQARVGVCDDGRVLTSFLIRD